jgi:hypothetical protein
MPTIKPGLSRIHAHQFQLRRSRQNKDTLSRRLETGKLYGFFAPPAFFIFGKKIPWHAGCNTSRVARKNHQNKVVRPAAQIAAMNLASVMNQISLQRMLARAPKPAPERRRLSILMFGGVPEPVKIRHAPQNVDSGDGQE